MGLVASEASHRDEKLSFSHVPPATNVPGSQQVLRALKSAFKDPSVERAISATTASGTALHWRDLARLLSYTWGRRSGWRGNPSGLAPVFPDDHQIGQLCEHEQYGLVCRHHFDTGERVSLVLTFDAVPVAAGPPSSFATAARDSELRILHVACSAIIDTQDGQRIELAGTEAGALGARQTRTSQFVQVFTDEGHTLIQRVEASKDTGRVALFVSADASQLQFSFDFVPETKESEEVVASPPFTVSLTCRAASTADHAPLLLIRDPDDPRAKPGQFGVKYTTTSASLSGDGTWLSWPRLRVEEKFSFVDVHGTRRRFAQGPPAESASAGWHIRCRPRECTKPPLDGSAMLIANMPDNTDVVGVVAAPAPLRNRMRVAATLRPGPHVAEDEPVQGWLEMQEGAPLDGPRLRLHTTRRRGRTLECLFSQNPAAVHMVHEGLHQQWLVQFFELLEPSRGASLAGLAIVLAPLPREKSAQHRLRKMGVAHVHSLARSLCASQNGLSHLLPGGVIARRTPADCLLKSAPKVASSLPSPAHEHGSLTLIALGSVFFVVLAYFVGRSLQMFAAQG